MLALNHFRSRIAGRPTLSFELLVYLKKKITFFIGVAEPKINNFNFAIVVNQDVLRLEISMGHPDRMQIFHPCDDLLENFAGFLLR